MGLLQKRMSQRAGGRNSPGTFVGPSRLFLLGNAGHVRYAMSGTAPDYHQDDGPQLMAGGDGG
jgi:hypothetical protein